MSEEEMLGWLKRALDNLESLPKLIPDEFPSSAIARLWKESLSDPHFWKRFLEGAALGLIQELRRKGEKSYTKELLGLVSGIKLSEATFLLAELAKSEKFSSLSEETRFSILSTLVDTPPCQSIVFWEGIFARHPEYASYVFSGILARSFDEAAEFLSRLKKREGDEINLQFWKSAPLKIDICEALSPEQKRRLLAIVSSEA